MAGWTGRRWLKVLIGVAVLAFLVAVVAPFVYIHFIEGSPPKKLALTKVATTTTSPTSAAGGSSAPTTGAPPTAVSDLDGTWKVSGGSQAGYRVKEVLFGQSTTAVGRTTKVEGTMALAGPKVSTSNVVVDLTSVSSDRSQRDGQFQGRIMDTAKFPTATFTLTEPIDLGTLPAEGKAVSTKAKGTLELHGTTKTVTVDLQAQRLGSGIQVSGAIPVTFSDYDIPNPTFGPAEVGDEGTIEFLLNYAKA